MVEFVSSPASKRVGIIGAGAVAVACAIHLQRAGHIVTMFDPRRPGGGASMGNSGILAVNEVLPFSRTSTLKRLPRMFVDPMGPLSIRPSYAPAIAPWLTKFLFACMPARTAETSTTLAGILKYANADWVDLLKDSAAATRLRETGWLRVYSSENELASARADIATQRGHGVEVDVLNRDVLNELEPAFRRRFAGAAYYKGAWSLNMPGTVIETLANEAFALGVSFKPLPVRDIRSDAQGVTLVDDLGNLHRFDHAVVAAGAWSRRFVKQLDLDTPLDTERGYHVMLDTPMQSIRHPVTVNSPGYTLAQMDDGLRLTTGIEFAGLEAAADLRRIRKMAIHAASLIEGLNPKPKTEWLGFRPSMPSSLPVIGTVPQQRNVVLAFGHGHLGVTLAPTTARIVTSLINGVTPPYDASAFKPR